MSAKGLLVSDEDREEVNDPCWRRDRLLSLFLWRTGAATGSRPASDSLCSPVGRELQLFRAVSSFPGAGEDGDDVEESDVMKERLIRERPRASCENLLEAMAAGVDRGYHRRGSATVTRPRFGFL